MPARQGHSGSWQLPEITLGIGIDLSWAKVGFKDKECEEANDGVAGADPGSDERAGGGGADRRALESEPNRLVVKDPTSLFP